MRVTPRPPGVYLADVSGRQRCVSAQASQLLAEPLALSERRTVVQQMQVKGFSSCSQHGQVVLEDPDGMVRLHIRMRPMMAHWLAHELKECQCPAVSVYRLLQELLSKFGGRVRVSL